MSAEDLFVGADFERRSGGDRIRSVALYSDCGRTSYRIWRAAGRPVFGTTGKYQRNGENCQGNTGHTRLQSWDVALTVAGFRSLMDESRSFRAISLLGVWSED